MLASQAVFARPFGFHHRPVVLLALAFPLHALAVVTDFRPETLGASGSVQTLTCTATQGAATLSCQGAGDFKVGQGVKIPQAGGLPHGALVTNVPAPTIKTEGSNPGGSDTYCYKVVVADPMGGMQPPSAAACIGGQGALSERFRHSVNTAKFEVKNGLPENKVIPLYLWYVSKNDGPFQLMHISISPAPGDNGEYWHVGGSYPNGDFGGWPRTLPAVTVGQPLRYGDFFTTITGLSGGSSSTAFTLARPPARSIANVTVEHDDTAAIQAAIDHVAAQGGGSILLSAPNYNTQRPSFVTVSADSVYTAEPPSSNSPGLIPTSHSRNLHLPATAPGNRNIALYGGVDGQGAPLTTVHAGRSLGGAAHWLDIGTVESHREGRPSSRKRPHVRLASKVDPGATVIQLADAASAATLIAGQDIWLYSGNFAYPAPGAADFKPCGDHATMAPGDGCHFSEINTIRSVDAASGTITLERPAAKRYWDDGHNSFGFMPIESVARGITLRNININSAHKLMGLHPAFDLTLDNIRLPRVIEGNVMGAGYKRGFRIQRSHWNIGSGSRGWSCIQEFDQVNDFTMTDNVITGHSTPGSEGPSQGAAIAFSEGTAIGNFSRNRLRNVALRFAEARALQVTGNVFINGSVWAGTWFRQDFSTPGNIIYRGSNPSFGPQGGLLVSANTFSIDAASEVPYIIRVGAVPNSRITGNIMTSQSSHQYHRFIVAGAGIVSNNRMTDHRLSAPYHRSYVLLQPDQTNMPLSAHGNTTTTSQAAVASVMRATEIGMLGTGTFQACVKDNLVNGITAAPLITASPSLSTYDFSAYCSKLW